jgi:hypothetical protein
MCTSLIVLAATGGVAKTETKVAIPMSNETVLAEHQLVIVILLIHHQKIRHHSGQEGRGPVRRGFVGTGHASNLQQLSRQRVSRDKTSL